MTDWHSRQRADAVTAAVFVLGGAASLASVSRMRVGAAAAFQPRLFPAVVSALLIVSGIALALVAARTPAHARVDWPTRTGTTRMGVFLVSVVAYLLVLETLGMPLATGLVVFFEVWYLGTSHVRVPILAGLLSALIVYGVFMYGLGLTLPAGIFAP